MQQQDDWGSKHFTPEQREIMRQLAKTSYSDEALQKLGERGWTEDDHTSHLQRYALFRAELRRLVERGAAPASTEAQALAQRLADMNKQYSQGDPAIIAGMRKSWEQFNALPDDKKPAVYVIDPKEREFIRAAMAIRLQNQAGGPA